MSEIRKDPLTGRGVIIAPERAQRPKQLGPPSDRGPSPTLPILPWQ